MWDYGNLGTALMHITQQTKENFDETAAYLIAVGTQSAIGCMDYRLMKLNACHVSRDQADKAQQLVNETGVESEKAKVSIFLCVATHVLCSPNTQQPATQPQ